MNCAAKSLTVQVRSVHSGAIVVDRATRSRPWRRAAGKHVRAPDPSRLLVDLSWASGRLEGNTYTRLDTQNLIELGSRAPDKVQRETQMILTHKATIEMFVENVVPQRLEELFDLLLAKSAAIVAMAIS